MPATPETESARNNCMCSTLHGTKISSSFSLLCNWGSPTMESPHNSESPLHSRLNEWMNLHLVRNSVESSEWQSAIPPSQLLLSLSLHSHWYSWRGKRMFPRERYFCNWGALFLSHTHQSSLELCWSEKIFREWQMMIRIKLEALFNGLAHYIEWIKRRRGVGC